jgi:ACS family tartrate transporter-like MFS transporter
MWRLMPFLFLLYIVAYLDRINVGFAVLQMGEPLHLTDRVKGVAFGMFFAGYFFFQVPSNLVLQKVGVRRWICGLMVVWGLVSCSMIFIRGPISFYVLRFLLGAAEAGFFPGMILYLKHWFPARARARAVAWFMTANPLAGVIGSPISGALLGIHSKGLAGWHWLFLMEGAPAILLGVAVLWILSETPKDASWLRDDERKWLVDELNFEGRAASGRRGNFWSVAADWRVWVLSLV